jgi:hypothetical protein
MNNSLLSKQIKYDDFNQFNLIDYFNNCENKVEFLIVKWRDISLENLSSIFYNNFKIFNLAAKQNDNIALLVKILEVYQQIIINNITESTLNNKTITDFKEEIMNKFNYIQIQQQEKIDQLIEKINELSK